MNANDLIHAIIVDMDGVLTRTAALHLEAWTQVLDEFLRSYNQRHRDNQPPFSRGDYRRHVDGKARYDGAEAFLRSRGMELPYGDPSDPPTEPTVCGLGNRKHEVFLSLLSQRGVKVHRHAVAACRRWRLGGLKLAIITSSKKGYDVLHAAGLLDLADTIVDGQVASKLQLKGREDLIKEAGRRLDLSPGDGVLIEESIAGVEAGKRAGCRVIVGVDRNGHAQALKDAGADLVVRSVASVRFPRVLPSLRDSFEEFDALRDGRGLALFADYDGTLSPIVNDPARAEISTGMRLALADVASHHLVAVISSRDRSFVEQRVGIKGLWYAGNHGMDIAGPGKHMVHPGAERVVPLVHEIEQRLRRELSEIKGVLLERKRFSLAVHYRNVQPEEAETVRRSALKLAQNYEELRPRHGKMVVELQPALDWDKGSAVEWLMASLRLESSSTLVVYLGDDETDEDAFEALNGRGVGVFVGPRISTSLASYRLSNPAEVLEFLRRLAHLPRQKEAS